MKRMLPLILVILSSVAPLWAQTHHSDFGFSVNLPSGWEVISKEETSRNPDMLDAAFGIARQGTLKDADKDMLAQLKTMVLTGNVEYYFKRENRSLISVLRKTGKFIQTPSDVGKTCESIPGELAKLMAKPARLYECDLRRMENFNAFYTVTDGFKEETKSLQYQIQKSPGELLIITATCRNQYCKEVDKELDQMVNSIKLR